MHGTGRTDEDRGEVLGTRYAIWMADHNCVDEPLLDSTKPESVPHHHTTVEAKARLAAAIGATDDVYRALHPLGTSTTHDANAAGGGNSRAAAAESSARRSSRCCSPRTRSARASA